MPTDLRAAVLRGLDEKIKHITALDVCDCREYPPTKDALTALGHLREIVEWHESMGVHVPMWCALCSGPPGSPMDRWVRWPCPILVSLAPDYAPQALKEMEADHG